MLCDGSGVLSSQGAFAGLGLQGRLDNLPEELSGGEQQRVAIARALANDPALILADEPTGDVDPETGTTILDILTARLEAGGKTLVIATHGAVPARLSARELRLENGELVPPVTGPGEA
jgi:putative ABC transport system ATP-binding protein